MASQGAFTATVAKLISRRRALRTLAAGALLGLGVAALPSFASAADKEPVVVASKIDGEGALLGNILLLMFEKGGIPTVNKVQMGATKVVREALLAGEIGIYPEYTGNGAFMLSDVGNPAWKNWEQGYERVKKLDAEKNHLVWLEPAPANNTWAIAVRNDLAEKYKLSSLKDLGPALKDGMPFKIAAGAEFVEREDALPSFEKTYSFDLNQDQILSFPGNNTAVFLKAAAEQNSGVNAAVVYGTDGAVASLGLTVLNDPEGAQPVYAPAPVVREAVLKAYPQIPELLNPVFKTLDTKTLQELNGEVAINGMDPKVVARDYLKAQGFL
ncbi:ABC transporter substrate-binding protein [Pokkaliibacter sp. CJK22405]|uniref:glycine betaine ABC transporter substrate-binding protein OsmF n=1 Tax=Pokkaliibacter sp. CJK22405 TaxID=3384615 RepID=UPI0039848E58